MSRHTSVRRARRSRVHSRRGVILLIVMLLIALFAVVTVGFVLISTLELKTAVQAARIERSGDQPAGLFDAALDQILRGSTSDNSVLGPHSLLEDLYGVDPLLNVCRGVTVNARMTSNASGYTLQLVDLEVSFATPDPNRNAAGYYNGRLLTMTSGSLAGTTVRIVDYEPAQSILRVLSPQPGDLSNPPNLPDLAGQQFLINERPFDGSGFGLGFLDPTMLKIDKTINHVINQNPSLATEPGWPEALLPNRSRMARTKLEWESGDHHYPDFAGLGGADEDYDAADYQNMLMALKVSTRLGAIVPLPSLHRPDLFRYWKLRETANWPTTAQWPVPTTAYATYSLTRLQRDLFRKLSLRPLPFDHPGFAAVNPALSTPDGLASLDPARLMIDTNGDGTPDAIDPSRMIWDVDNDGDGSPDSIWVDLGFPVQTDAKGRRYKPLFAILCHDLDGRLNLNAHAAPELVRGPPGNPINGNPPRGARNINFIGPIGSTAAPASAGQALLPVGTGHGPADIRLNEVFASNVETMKDLQRLLFGRYDTSVTPALRIDGRYGESYLLNEGVAPMPGRTTIWGRLAINNSTPSDIDADNSGAMDADVLLQTADGSSLIPDLNDDNFPPAPSRWLPLDPSWSLATFRGNVAQMGKTFWTSGAGTVNLTTTVGPLGSPMDVDGDGAIAFDFSGRPITFSHSEGNDLVDDPYEIDLSRSRAHRWQPAVKTTALDPGGRMAAADMPFTPGELEGLLRVHDIDSCTLDARLMLLAPTSLAVAHAPESTQRFLEAAYRRTILTTESWDQPVANQMIAMPEMLNDLPASAPTEIKQQFQLLETALSAGGISLNPLAFRYTNLPRLAVTLQALLGGTLPPDFNKELREVLYPGYFDSLRMDLNFTFGNSYDDNNNLVVDEPGETTPNAGLGDPQRLWAGSEAQIGPVEVDLNGDGIRDNVDRNADNVLDDNDLVVRQALARHLYFLAVSMRNVVMTSPSKLPDPKAEITKLELAQWAVNVVDYMDRDSISTGFEVDLEPGDGWLVDGNLDTIEKDPMTGAPSTERAVVWGLERPELLLTEAVAIHDICTADTGNYNKLFTTSPTKDDDLDQVRYPQGSLFFELFNPQGLGQAPSAEFYSRRNGSVRELTPGLNLRAKDMASEKDPVWRVVIWKNDRHLSEDELLELRRNPTFPAGDSPSYASEAQLTAHERTDNTIERSVYFIEPDTAVNKYDGRKYYPSNSAAQSPAYLGYGMYAVAGPAQTNGGEWRTVIGGSDLNTGSRPRMTFSPVGTTAPTKFQVDQDGAAVPYPRYDGDLNPNPIGANDERIRPVLGLLIDGPVIGANRWRMSISEPAALSLTRPYPGRTLVDPMDLTSPFEDSADLPFDVRGPIIEDWANLAAGVRVGDLGPPPADRASETQAQANDETETVATPDALLNYRHLFLQRLANPLVPYDRKTNPYLTVDWTPVDLTLFNSTFSANNLAKLQSRQRGGANSNVWTEEEWNDKQRVNGPATFKFQHTLGYLNQAFHVPGASPSAPRWLTPGTLSELGSNAASLSALGYDATYFTGAPKLPFPWICIPNRPLNSQYELLLVPKSSPSLIGREFTLRQGTATDNRMYSDKRGRFEHLLNFFGSNTGGFPLGVGGMHNDLYRIFDFVQVRSPFSGTETMLSPQDFADYPLAAPATSATPTTPIFGWFRKTAGASDTYVRSFRPPFNRILNFREPGRINLNTIFDEGHTLEALAGGNFDDAVRNIAPIGNVDLWTRFVASRRGQADSLLITDALTGVQQMLAHDPRFPSLISNPFRTFSGGHLAPIADLQRAGINATLLRPDPAPQGINMAPLPGTGRNDPEPPIAQTGLFELTGTARPAAPTNNAYFSFQLYNRLGNLTTTRSNVFAVWITVGYFEVEPVPPAADDPARYKNWDPTEFDQVYPDKCRLKAELGMDTGEVTRHRAFYLIDRTIPVAFERGVTHNARDTVILRRVIE